MTEEKGTVSFRIGSKLLDMVDRYIIGHNLKNRSYFFRKAIEAYMDFFDKPGECSNEVRISAESYQRLQDISTITGEPITTGLNIAIDEYHQEVLAKEVERRGNRKILGL